MKHQTSRKVKHCHGCNPVRQLTLREAADHESVGHRPVPNTLGMCVCGLGSDAS